MPTFLLVGVLNAQALNYLGIRVGAEGVYQGWEYDSTYNSFSGSTAGSSTAAETLQVNQEFTYSGNLGRGILRKRYLSGFNNDTTVYVDTVYEVGGDMRRLMIVGTDSNATLGIFFKKLDVLAIKTPLTVGDVWTLGVAGTSVAAEVDGDGDYSLLDTLLFLLDTVKVLSMGTLTVPAGTFDSVYTIHVAVRGKLWSSSAYNQTGSSSESWSDTLIRDYYVFWRPGVGLVKDSMYQYVEFTPFFVTVRVFKWSVNEMVYHSVPVDVSERDFTDHGGITLSGNLLILKEDGVVHDPSGRVVFRGEGSVRLSRGVYFVVEGRRVYRVLIR